VGDEPKPLSADKLTDLESKAGVTGLSTVDLRRLLANNDRLRQLLINKSQALPRVANARDVSLASTGPSSGARPWRHACST
jgi:hypothetical protein